MSAAGSASAEREQPFVTPNDYRVIAHLARQRNQWVVRARLAGEVNAARRHQDMADWLIAKARMCRAEWAA